MIAAVTSAVWALLPGCTGTATIEASALNYRAIDPPRALAARLRAHQCYWWTEDDRVLIALESERRAILAPGLEQVFQMSLSLERLPRGKARNYRVGTEELRARVRIGPMEGRFTSTRGIVAIYRDGANRLRGSFRLQVRRETAQLLGGFAGAAVFQFQGVFDAVHDPQRGRSILTATESAGYERSEPSAAAPTAE